MSSGRLNPHVTTQYARIVATRVDREPAGGAGDRGGGLGDDPRVALGLGGLDPDRRRDRGGGWVTWETGEAQISVFGSTFNVEDSDDPVIFGSLRWADAAGFTLTSESIASYGPTEPTERARELRGLLRNSDGETLHAFTLTMVDGGGPGDALDTIALVVGPALEEGASATPESADAPAVAVISVDGTLEVGDLQMLTFEFTG